MIVRGDFSRLAHDYAKFRPGYSLDVAHAIIGIARQPKSMLLAVDVGAGTGIWTRTLQEAGISTLVAVEPNDEMRAQGEAASVGIDWKKGTAEQTGIEKGSIDLLTMASAFHWADTEVALAEFNRVLRHDGILALLWNPRSVEKSPEETRVQELLDNHYRIGPRVSSGRGGITNRLTDLLSDQPLWRDVIYCEAHHERTITAQEYIGTWRSVNDIRNQLGEEQFSEFLEKIAEYLDDTITVHYVTRAWIARAR